MQALQQQVLDMAGRFTFCMHSLLKHVLRQVCGESERASLGYIGREEAADEGVALTYVVCSLAELEVLDVRKRPDPTSAQQVMVSYVNFLCSSA